MSRKQISRSPDLQRLWDEGYDIEVRSRRFLLVKSIPYVNTKKDIALGVLVSTLNLAGDVTVAPDTHVTTWIGDHPCRPDGSPISSIRHPSSRQELERGLVIDHTFSNKVSGGGQDPDYYHKMTRYVDIIVAQAQAIDPAATPKVNRFIDAVEQDSPFVYADSASSNDGIAAINQKLELESVAIVGLGGTGSYVLDLVAKTPVKAIHLYDGDSLLQHNAFRSPGAVSGDVLRTVPEKVEYYKQLYSNMHRGIEAHPYYLDRTNSEELRAVNFAFLSLDRGHAKREVVGSLLEAGIPFIDVGMGIDRGDDAIGGILAVTLVTPTKQDHSAQRIAFSDADPNDDYSRRIQIADLNALNAALAVIKWKKYLGFYRDLGREHHISYTIDVDMILNEDLSE